MGDERGTFMQLIKAINLWRWIFSLLFTYLLLFSHSAVSLEVHAQGLFKNAAVLSIDGKRRMMKVGKPSPEGVLLIESNTKEAVIEVNGQRQKLTLSRRISGSFVKTEKTEVAIPRNSYNQYITNASINGRRIEVLVDTGATSVAMSSRHAEQLGIDYKQGRKSAVITASGRAKAYTVKLRSVEVGGIAIKGLDASVIEGDFPMTILLGMTYLEHVHMREQNGTLFLQAKY
jgi:aspartyl protease family protein